VKELMGHKNIATTMRYAHLSPEHQLDAVQRLNRKPTAPTTATGEGEKLAAAEGIAEVLSVAR
jgi:hypothetical protein